MSQYARATSYVVLPAGSYADTATDYVACNTRADVEGQLVDYGYLSNPAVSVYTVLKGQVPADVIDELVESHDPYPDFIVERGPLGGVKWTRA